MVVPQSWRRIVREMWEIIGQFIWLIFCFIFWLAAKVKEEKYLKSLREEEPEYSDVQILSTVDSARSLEAKDCCLCSTQIVLAIDPGKQFIAYVLGMVGGKIDVYQKVLHMARRKAKLNLKKQARENNSKLIMNYRMETSNIFANSGSEGQSSAVEVFAYGTIVKS
ncbi:hypothetical protein CL645_04635 [bacterium]|nr:hypothetical protein [bacterium]